MVCAFTKFKISFWSNKVCLYIICFDVIHCQHFLIIIAFPIVFSFARGQKYAYNVLPSCSNECVFLKRLGITAETQARQHLESLWMLMYSQQMSGRDQAEHSLHNPLALCPLKAEMCLAPLGAHCTLGKEIIGPKTVEVTRPALSAQLTQHTLSCLFMFFFLYQGVTISTSIAAHWHATQHTLLLAIASVHRVKSWDAAVGYYKCSHSHWDSDFAEKLKMNLS